MSTVGEKLEKRIRRWLEKKKNIDILCPIRHEYPDESVGKLRRVAFQLESYRWGKVFLYFYPYDEYVMNNPSELKMEIPKLVLRKEVIRDFLRWKMLNQPRRITVEKEINSVSGMFDY